MTSLYPLKFKPQAKATVWGGNKLNALFNKPFPATKKIGESWELSAVQRNLSVLANGFLKGNTIEELMEVYLGELMGEKNYERFGIEFPVLVKLIDAAETLSVQVHPDDETARIRHNAYGKTEMWHILQADDGAGLYVGFNRNLTAMEFYNRVQNNTLLETLNFVTVQPGDTFFITPGTIHAIGKGIVLAEIQQTSDITYRIYDWGREHDPATARAMHVEQAIDIIDYTEKTNAKIDYARLPNEPVQLVDSPYFVTNLVEITDPLERNLSGNDSFVIYVCIDGDAIIQYGKHFETVTKGETLLIPAAIADVTLLPSPKATLLETYIM
ncbi:MAG: class I mannose-6-phosphate isomerase [Prevotellaceae bacterium]|nr:class I mannose-6-phosphate isomerase [Prevotellaceae bacterium]